MQRPTDDMWKSGKTEMKALVEVGGQQLLVEQPRNRGSSVIGKELKTRWREQVTLED